MKKRYVILLFLVSLSFNCIAQNDNESSNSNPSIALLGTFHFAGSSDMAGIKAEDITSTKRQKEIQQLVDAIAVYKPTKVILEYPYGKTKLDSLYQLYLKGEHILTINERQQVGFRLAKQLGHEHIFTADVKMDLPFDKITEYLQKEGKMDQMQTMMEEVMKFMSKMQEVYDSKDLKEFYMYMNSDEFDNLNKNLYLEYINKMGAANNPVGSEVAATWWHRNFKIMRNIDAIAEKGDRIFLLFGQGHTAIFKDFYKTRRDYKYEEITSYLKN